MQTFEGAKVFADFRRRFLQNFVLKVRLVFQNEISDCTFDESLQILSPFILLKKAVSRNEVCTIIISFSCTVSVSSTSSNRLLILWYQPCFGILSNILNIEQFEVDACRTISIIMFVVSNFFNFLVFNFYNKVLLS